MESVFFPLVCGNDFLINRLPKTRTAPRTTTKISESPKMILRLFDIRCLSEAQAQYWIVLLWIWSDGLMDFESNLIFSVATIQSSRNPAPH
jgi:hypothetical protein